MIEDGSIFETSKDFHPQYDYVGPVEPPSLKDPPENLACDMPLNSPPLPDALSTKGDDMDPKPEDDNEWDNMPLSQPPTKHEENDTSLHSDDNELPPLQEDNGMPPQGDDNKLPPS